MAPKTTLTRPNETALRMLDAPFESWTKASLARWQPASFPTGDGGTWTWAEPKAKSEIKQGGLELAVERFTRSHDQVQIFDNPKHLVACSAPIKVPEEGVLVETSMSCRMHNENDEEWGEGFASFNLMDFEHGLVLDGLANAHRSAILFERLFIPGMIPKEQTFTTIADGPRSKGAGGAHTYKFLYEPREKRIQGWIDGQPVYEYRNVPFRINAFTAGFGLITLRPITNDKSVSNRGQGATGWLGPIRTSRLA